MSEWIPGPWKATNEEYHADRSCESSSTLECFRKSVPLYYLIYVKGALHRPPAKQEQLLGSALHSLILEPETFTEEVAVAPVCDRRTTAGKAIWADFLARSTSARIILEAGQEHVLYRMADAISRHKVARNLLAQPGHTEYSVRWTDPDTEIRLKARYDRMIHDGPMLDLKTSSDPYPLAWGKSAATYGYHRQTAIYLASRQQLFCEDYGMLHIVIGTQEPHEVVVYRIAKADIQMGSDQVADSLMLMESCRRSDDWSSRFAETTQDINLPGFWAKN